VNFKNNQKKKKKKKVKDKHQLDINNNIIDLFVFIIKKKNVFFLS